MRGEIAIDTSVIVRYLTGDDPVQSAEATELFLAAEAGRVRLLIPASAIQETVYVLESLFELDAEAIAPKLIALLSLPNVRSPDAAWLLAALQSYREKNSDFGDALLCAYAARACCGVATFDKGILKKFKELPVGLPGDWLSGNVAR
jgi:predicted nucleic acid-binding protein